MIHDHKTLKSNIVLFLIFTVISLVVCKVIYLEKAIEKEIFNQIAINEAIKRQKLTNTEFLNKIQDTKTITTLCKKHKISYEFAETVLNFSRKYEQPDFPKSKDILAIISIESGFNPNAKSNLKNDPAKGLMQIRVKMWKELIGSNEYNIENQIKNGAAILSIYYKKLKNKKQAVMAYNMGIGSIKSGNVNYEYFKKYSEAVQFLENIS